MDSRLSLLPAGREQFDRDQIAQMYQSLFMVQASDATVSVSIDKVCGHGVKTIPRNKVPAVLQELNDCRGKALCMKSVKELDVRSQSIMSDFSLLCVYIPSF